MGTCPQIVVDGQVYPHVFLAQYPEFGTAPSSLVAAALTQAAAQINATVYGEDYSLAVGLKAAHWLAIKVFGETARLSKNSGETTYSAAFAELQSAVVAIIGR